MNGRALNEKVIEVSPSSNRVLDRAADILASFPPSKNRPRPGDWTCPSCGFSNFQRRTACFRCSYPAMSDHQQPHMYGQGYGGPPHMMGHHGMSMGHGAMGGMGRGSGHGHGDSRIPFRAGDWRCGADGCNYHNFAKNVSCLRCGASRASAALGMGDPSAENHGPYGMGPVSMAGTSGGNNFGGGPPPYQNQGYGPMPPSTYALPAGIGAGAPPFPPMNGAYGHNNSMPPSNFDSRTEAAFTSAGAPNGGPPVTNGGHSYGPDASSGESYNFLSTGLNNLSVNDTDESRRNGATSKSPA